MKAFRFSQLTRCWPVAWGLCLMQLAWGAAPTSTEPPPTFVMGASEGNTKLVSLWQTMVYQEAFRRLGVPLKFTVAPLKRITMMSEQGLIDGEPGRAPAYGAAHPEMLVVDFPLMDLVFSIYAAKPMPGLNSINALRDSELRGTYARGALGCENVLKPLFPEARLTAVASAKNGLAMLALDRADFYCDVSSSMVGALKSANAGSAPQVHKLFDLGPKVPMRAYVQKKHAALAPALASTLKQIKEEGLFEKYWLEAEKQTLVP